MRKHPILFRRSNGQIHKLTNVIFGRDGSVYVSAPFYREGVALLMKQTVNYDRNDTVHFTSETSTLGRVDDERVKLSHHESGLVQFSGHGLVSGVDEEGNIRGIGAWSWPLNQPPGGPMFTVGIADVTECDVVTSITKEQLLIDESDITPIPQGTGLSLEGHYFTPMWRRFIRPDSNGRKSILISHPAGSVLNLPVVLAPENCGFPGFIGIEVYSIPMRLGDAPGGFTMGGSSENIRLNEAGERLGDVVGCIFPAPADLEGVRSLAFVNPTANPHTN